jgi:hypothetical protein
MIEDSETARHVELFCGLERACKEFPPLYFLLSKLAAIEGNERSDLDTLVLALHEFFQSVDLPSNASPKALNGNPLELLTKLVFALDDLSNGREPYLFKRESKAQNRSMKTDWGIAADLLISARHYLIQKFRRDGEIKPEKFAETGLARKLHALGVQIDANKIDSLCRYHNSEEARRNRRPDLRARKIRTDRELTTHLNLVAAIMRGRTA